MKTKVYVSGPYTIGDPCINTHNMLKAANRILDAGFIPFVPLLSHFWHTATPRDYEDWMEIDFAFIPACDVFLRLPGESKGADRELQYARELGKTIYYGIEELLEHAGSNG